MSKINQIQNALKELDGGKFQKLADAYIYEKGYEKINPLGSVVGVDKVRKGTPDTHVSLPNGKYIFVEYTTTQPDKLYEKFNSDLDKCFDTNKTGISIKDIEGIILCHTSLRSPEEEKPLFTKCKKHKVKLNIFGIGEISYDLKQKYPGIARDFLGINIDTGQILPISEFITAYNKSKLVARLDTAFHFRKTEADLIIQSLSEDDLVLITGRPGIGKSRLALECCMRFKDMHPEYEIRCILNRGPDIFDDLKVHFSTGRFLILVDDANRINQFKYIIQTLQDQRDDQRIKVLVTVRDYALGNIHEAIQPYGNVAEIELKILDDTEIKQLVKDEYGITNEFYLDRISKIAHGNTRLAIMAAEIAKEKNRLDSIFDVTSLYDEYFSSIRQDLEDLADKRLLKVAGIIAFFRVIDRSNEEMMGSIEKAFSISPDIFWEAAYRLHNMEIIDIYEGEDVARASDQVLATYLFYLAFFKDQILEFSVILDWFFPRLYHRIIDIVYPILNIFNRQSIQELICPSIEKILDSLKESGDEKSLLLLMEGFWFLVETKTLLYIRDTINEMDVVPFDVRSLELKADSYISSPSLLKVLSSFQYEDDTTFKIIMNNLLDYLVKRPEDISKVLHILSEDFGFKPLPYVSGYPMQSTIIDLLWNRTRDGESALHSKLFIAVAEQYLQTSFRTCELKGGRTYSIITFCPPSIPELIELRRTIWNRILQLGQRPIQEKNILTLLHNYCASVRFNYHNQDHQNYVKHLITHDSYEIIPFIKSQISPTKFGYCYAINSYLDLLDECGVSYDLDLRDRFNGESLKLSKILLADRLAKRDFDDYKKIKMEQIKEYFASFTLNCYERFFKLCLEIQSDLPQNNRYHLENGITDVFIFLADSDSDLFVRVLEQYLKSNISINLDCMTLIKKLIKISGSKHAFEILNKYDYFAKRACLFCYYASLPSNEITHEHQSNLYALYREAQPSDFFRDLDFLLNYRLIDKKIVVKITELLLDKSKENISYSYALSTLFNPYTEINKAITDLFAEDFDILERAYFAVSEVEKYMDYDGKTFSRILKIDPKFILNYIGYIYEGNGRPDSQEDTRDYAFLWERDNYKELINSAIDRIYSYELGQNSLWNIYVYARAFFVIHEGSKKQSELFLERQNSLLEDLIKTRNSDLYFMEFLFSIISHCPEERRRLFLSMFLEYNKNFEAFHGLPLEPTIHSWSGSAVSMYQERVNFFESLLPLVNTIDLLDHKLYVEKIIKGLRSDIEWEKKRNFMED